MTTARRSALAVFALALLLVATPITTAASTHYSNSRASFDLPDGWTGPDSGDPAADGGVTYTSADSSIAMNVVSTPLPGTGTLDDVVQAAIMQFAMSAGYQGDPNGEQSDTIGGEPAFTYTFVSNNSSGTPISTITYFVVHSGQIYAITFATSPDNTQAASIAQGIVDSWQFI